MNYKNYLNGILIFMGIILLSCLIITILYSKDIINTNIIKILKIIILIISTLISGFYIGIKSKNKGYISGLTLSGIIILPLLIIRIIISKQVKLANILIYLIILILTTTSSILGINKKR